VVWFQFRGEAPGGLIIRTVHSPSAAIFSQRVNPLPPKLPPLQLPSIPPNNDPKSIYAAKKFLDPLPKAQAILPPNGIRIKNIFMAKYFKKKRKNCQKTSKTMISKTAKKSLLDRYLSPVEPTQTQVNQPTSNSLSDAFSLLNGKKKKIHQDMLLDEFCPVFGLVRTEFICL